VDYFPLDVHLDDKVTIIEAEHGLSGFAILIKLLQKIYSEGYFYEWGEVQQILFCKSISTDRNTVETIIKDCVKWGIFNEKLFNEYNILTSKGIQTRYFQVIYKRTDVKAIKEYLLIDIKDKNNVSCCFISDIRNKDVTIVSDIESTQSKVKESKGKERKEKDAEIKSFILEYPLKEIKNLMINETSHLETLCLNNNLSKEKILLFLDNFFKKLENEGVEKKSVNDSKAHFARWLNIEKKKQEEQEVDNTIGKFSFLNEKRK
jgi:hypothetical protein